MLHIPFFEGSGSLRGTVPGRRLRRRDRLRAGVDEYGAKLFSSGAFLSGVLETDKDLWSAGASSDCRPSGRPITRASTTSTARAC